LGAANKTGNCQHGIKKQQKETKHLERNYYQVLKNITCCPPATPPPRIIIIIIIIIKELSVESEKTSIYGL